MTNPTAGSNDAKVGGSPGEVYAYVHFDAAMVRLRCADVQRRMRQIRASALRCVGFPTLIPSEQTVQELSNHFGVAVTRWEHALEPDRYAAVWAAMCDESNDMDRIAPPHLNGLPWSRLRANERVLYRMAPPALLETILGDALARGEVSGIVVPWLTDRYDLVERHGMLGMDAPAHELVEVLGRLRRDNGATIHPLLSDMGGVERRMIRRSAIAMSAARHTLIAARAMRDAPASRRPVPFSEGSQSRCTIGYLVGGASQWNMLRPLLEHAAPTHRQFILSHDIFRNPTARRTLCDARVPFTPIEGELGRVGAIRSLLRTSRHRRTILNELDRLSLHSSRQRRHRLLEVDLAALPELDFFVDALECAIRRRNLDVLVTANCVDSYLGAATEACRRAGIRHACIQNAAFEAVRLPVFADCDAYFAESRRFANFMRDANALGDVHAVGLPYYDRLACIPQTASAVFKELDIAPGKRLIGVTTQTDLIDFSEILEELVSLTQRRHDVAVVIKLHPREDGSAYASFGKRLRSRRAGGIVQHIPLEAFLGPLAALVSVVSTTIHWAILRGIRPFSWLIPNFAMFAEAVDYMHSSVTFGSPVAHHVIAAVERHLDDAEYRATWEQSRREFIDEFSTGADGGACGRILAHIEHLAISSSSR